MALPLHHMYASNSCFDAVPGLSSPPPSAPPTPLSCCIMPVLVMHAIGQGCYVLPMPFITCADIASAHLQVGHLMSRRRRLPNHRLWMVRSNSHQSAHARSKLKTESSQEPGLQGSHDAILQLAPLCLTYHELIIIPKQVY